MSSYPPLSGPLHAIPLVVGTALTAAGLRYIYDQKGTSETYGVPPSTSLSSRQSPQQAGDVYLTVAGIRVFYIGGAILAFALLRDRRATGVAVGLATAVPVLDGVVAFRHAKERWAKALGHWVPAVGTAVLSWKLLVLCE
ncbi:hypothetical protein MNV49_006575 [Pseudohyphozyma bogoriensis]|nr:hypothetical protein MNV49_006575 [Pseudohyphozyma bogoriensis]